MSDRNLARLGVSLALVNVALALGAIILQRQVDSRTGTIGLLVGLTGFTIVGSVLAARRPRNPIGWLFLCAGLGGAADKVFEGLAIYGLVTAPGSIPFALIAGWLVPWSGLLLTLALPFSLLLFPSGRLPSQRWRPVAVAVGLFVLITLVLFQFGVPLGSAQYPQITNPFLVPALVPIASAVSPIFEFGAFVLVLVVALASLVARYRAGSIAERQQLKWIVLAAVVMVGLFGISSVAPALREASWAVGLTVLPTAVAIAILRHKLYDIDHLINRTLVYGATTGVIAVLFFAGIVALQPLLRPLTEGSDLAVAASTLVAFALFQPIRRRVQEAVDRRFDRSRYDAARTLDAFTEDLRDEVDLDDLRADLIGAVGTTMAPAHASLWLREGRR